MRRRAIRMGRGRVGLACGLAAVLLLAVGCVNDEAAWQPAGPPVGALAAPMAPPAAAPADAAAPPAAARNLLANSSFELGLGRFWKVPFFMVVEAEDAPHRQRVLRFPVVGASGVMSRPVPLEAGTYTLSFYARSDGQGQVKASVGAMGKRRGGPQRLFASGRFDLTDQWKRYEVTGTIEEVPTGKDLGGWQRPCMLVQIDGPAKQPWSLDAVMLEKADAASPYRPGAAVEVALATDQIGHIINAGQPRELIVRAHSELAEPAELPVEVHLTDLHRREVETLRVTLATRPGATVQQRVTLTTKRTGIFLAEATRGRGGAVLDEMTVTLLPYEAGPVAGFGGVLPLNYYNLKVARALGMGWVVQVDASHATAWAEVEAEQGTYDWAESDEAIRIGRELGFDILGVLGDAPKWAIAEGVRSRRTLPPKEHWDAYERFVRACVERYKDQITYWMPWDEPYNHGPAEDYLALHRRAARAARAADPDAKIVGPMTNSVAAGWTEKLLGLGILEDIDVFCVSGWGMSYPQMCQARRWARADGQDRPLWDNAFGMGSPTFYRNLILDGEADVARRVALTTKKMVNDLRAGCERVSMYWAVIHHAHVAGSKSFIGTFDYDGTPTPHMVAAGITAHQLAGAEPVRAIRLGRNIRGHVFARPGGAGALAVLWTTPDAEREMASTIDDVNLAAAGGKRAVVEDKGLTATMTLNVPAGALCARDLYANAVRLAGRRQAQLRLSDYPLFVAAPALQPAELADAIDAAAVTGLGEPVSLAARVAAVDGKPAFCVYVVNNSHRPADVTVELTELPDGLTLERTSLAVHLQPWQERALTFGIAALDRPVVRGPVAYTVTINGQRRTARKSVDILTCLPVAGVQIDGDLGEWDWAGAARAEAREQVHRGAEAWGGPEDVSFRLVAGWDEEALYLAARIRDDSVRRSHARGGALWADDCLEVFLDADVLGDLDVPRHTDDDWQMMFSPADPNSPYKQADWYATNRAEGLQFASRRTDDGYTAEIRLPWKNLRVQPAGGQVIGFDANVEDTDSQRKERPIIYWAGDTQDWKNTAGYGSLLLVGE